jgi:bifunctional lysine-specific demethylase and histidyl-hydroxylase NO66
MNPITTTSILKGDHSSSGASASAAAAGMSRAAKKRAKKKQKKSSSSEQPNIEATLKEKKRSIDETTLDSSSKQASPEIKGGFNSSKRIKSIIQNVSSNMGVGRRETDEEEEDTKRNGNNKKSSAYDQYDSHLASVPITEIPDLPLNISLVSILSMNDPNPNASSNLDDDNLLQQQQQLESLTAKQRGACLLQAILAPISLQEFYQKYWEKKPLVVKATAANQGRFDNLLSIQSIKAMTKKHPQYYGQDINVTKYKMASDGVKRRITLDKGSANDEEQATASLVDATELWSNYQQNGCTIRLLCPHKHHDAIQALLSNLETEFQCMVGANAYLTPPNASQGFAPHYDDIEAFCLQLEGSKRWKVYQPTLSLPRTSSEDFTTDDVQSMKLEMDIVLEPGDLLYMPRGWIHQACTLKDNNEQHSLHLTVSAMQQWAWIDLMEMILPEAMEAVTASKTSTLLRQGLPRGFMEYMGVMYQEAKDDKLPESLQRVTEEEAAENEHKRVRIALQKQFRAQAKTRIMAIADAAMDMIDATCDQMAKRFLSERQPPALTAHEKCQTAQADEMADAKTILPHTQCRLVRPGVGRLVIEDDKAVIYHCVDNAREYLGNPLSPLEFELDDGPALEQLLTTVEPDWILVNDLFHDTIEDKIAVTQALYDEGILAIEQTQVEEDNDDTS